ncbi:MAG: corrinoid protein [Coriobacteriales bacterium]|jgi:5-methyltetrahydrofolate--homocysteine methyltransferase
MAVLDDINAAIQKGKKKLVVPLVQQAIDEGIDAKDILEALLDGFSVIGDAFRRDEVFVPEVLVAARAMNAGTALLKPLLEEAGAEPLGKACLGTVEGDMHDIGKNIVRMMVEGKGIEVEDLGIDVKAETFVDYVREHPDCHLVLASALLTTTMPKLSEVVKAFEDAGLRDQVKIMVGGAPVTQEFADQIGADAYTPDGGSCAIKAAEILAEMKA